MAASSGEGWSRALTSSFDEATPLGAWPGPIAAKDWRSRQAGATDSSGRGTYDSSKTVSEGGGLLDVWIHSAVDGAPHVHNPDGRRYTAAPIPTMGHTLGARISMCMRADVVPGYKIAFLLWPDEGPGNFHGEIDFPEARLLDHASPTAFMHYAPKPSSGKDQDAYETGVSLQDWHVYTTEWNPIAPDPYVKFFLDGALIGHSTEHVPTRPMQLVLQIETFLAGQELPPPAQGHVQIDWVTIDLP
jgi:beta-glucanase (GH16 family)